MASTASFLKHPLKLISSWFETPPQIAVDPSQLADAASAPATVNHLAGPEGLCGWVPSETGTQDWVCQAFGQNMPAVVFIVSMTVVALTILFLFSYVRRSRRAIAEIKKLTEELEGDLNYEKVLKILRNSTTNFSTELNCRKF